MTQAIRASPNPAARSLSDALARRCADALHWHGADYAAEVFTLCIEAHGLTMDQAADVWARCHAILNCRH